MKFNNNKALFFSFFFIGVCNLGHANMMVTLMAKYQATLEFLCEKSPSLSSPLPICRKDYKNLIKSRALNEHKNLCGKKVSIDKFDSNYQKCLKEFSGQYSKSYIGAKTYSTGPYKRLEEKFEKYSAHVTDKVDRILNHVLKNNFKEFQNTHRHTGSFLKFYLFCPRNIPLHECGYYYKTNKNHKNSPVERIIKTGKEFDRHWRFYENFYRSLRQEVCGQRLDIEFPKERQIYGPYFPSKLYCFYKLESLMISYKNKILKEYKLFAPAVRNADYYFLKGISVSPNLLKRIESLPFEKYKEVNLNAGFSWSRKPNQFSGTPGFYEIGIFQNAIRFAETFNFYDLMCSIPRNCPSYLSGTRLISSPWSDVKKDENGLYKRKNPMSCGYNLLPRQRIQCTKMRDEIVNNLKKDFLDSNFITDRHFKIYSKFFKRKYDELPSTKNIKNILEKYQNNYLYYVHCFRGGSGRFLYNYHLYPHEESDQKGIDRIQHPACSTLKIPEEAMATDENIKNVSDDQSNHAGKSFANLVAAVQIEVEVNCSRYEFKTCKDKREFLKTLEPRMHNICNGENYNSCKNKINSMIRRNYNTSIGQLTKSQKVLFEKFPKVYVEFPEFIIRLDQFSDLGEISLNELSAFKNKHCQNNQIKFHGSVESCNELISQILSKDQFEDQNGYFTQSKSRLVKIDDNISKLDLESYSRDPIKSNPEAAKVSSDMDIGDFKKSFKDIKKTRKNNCVQVCVLFKINNKRTGKRNVCIDEVSSVENRIKVLSFSCSDTR